LNGIEIMEVGHEDPLFSTVTLLARFLG
jgi:hypothetical protein